MPTASAAATTAIVPIESVVDVRGVAACESAQQTKASVALAVEQRPDGEADVPTTTATCPGSSSVLRLQAFDAHTPRSSSSHNLVCVKSASSAGSQRRAPAASQRACAWAQDSASSHVPSIFAWLQVSLPLGGGHPSSAQLLAESIDRGRGAGGGEEIEDAPVGVPEGGVTHVHAVGGGIGEGGLLCPCP